MAYGRELAIRPSVTKAFGGVEQERRSLTEEEREALGQKVCRRLGERLSAYYAARPEEWKRIRNEI